MPERFCNLCWFDSGRPDCDCDNSLYHKHDKTDWRVGKCNVTTNHCHYAPYPGTTPWPTAPPLTCQDGFPCTGEHDRWCYYKIGDGWAHCF